MGCKLCKKNFVWKFTNKRTLCRDCFVKYFEKKVRGTIRKYKMPICSVRGTDLRVKVINNILGKLKNRKGKISEESLDDISNKILHIIMYGDGRIEKMKPKNQPLYFLSNKEILLYAKIKKIRGKLKKNKDNKVEKIDKFIQEIEKRNPDVRHDIVNALLEVKS